MGDFLTLRGGSRWITIDFHKFLNRPSPYLMGTVSVLKTDIKKCDNTALTTYFYIVRAVLSLKFETIYRIERYVCNPISLLIIIHGDAIGLL